MRSHLKLVGLATLLFCATAIAPSSPFAFPALSQTTPDRKAEADRLLQQGIQQIESREPEAALQRLEQALKIYRDIKDRQGEGKALANLGRAHFAFQSYTKAIEYSEQSLAIAHAVKDQPLEVAVLKRLGLIYSLTGNHAKAISMVENRLAIHQNSNNRAEVVRTLSDLGFVYLRAGNPAKAIEMQERGVKLAQTLKDDSLIFEARGNLEETYIILRGDALREQMGQVPLATALPVEQSTTQRRAEADRLLQQGIQQLQNNQYSDAERVLEKSVKLYQQIGDQVGEARSLIGLGKTRLALGNSAQALELIQQAVTIAKALKNSEIENSARQVLELAQRIAQAEQRREEAERLGEQALEQLLKGEFNAAYQSSQQALAIYRALNDRPQELGLLESFAVMLTMISANNLEHTDRVVDYYKEALIIAQELQDREAEKRIVKNLSFIQGNQADYSHRAIKDDEQELVIARQLQDQNAEMLALKSLGHTYHELQDYAKAAMYYEQMITLARRFQTSSNKSDVVMGLSEEGFALAGFGKIYAAQGNYTKAIEYHQKQLKVLDQIYSEFREFRDTLKSEPLSGIGYALQQQNQPELAIVFYKQVVNILEANRQLLRENMRQWEQSEFQPSEFYRAFYRWSQESIVRNNAPTYRRLADLLFQQNRIIEGMQVLDLLKVQDLQDFLKDIQGNALTQKGVELLPEEIVIRHILQTAPQQSLQTALQSSSIQAQVQSLKQTAVEQNLKLNSYQDLQSRTKKLGKNIALFYPLVLDDRLELVIFTSDRPPIRKPVAISAKQLETEIQTFREQLEGRSPLIKQPAQKLYQSLIQPIEAELQAAEVKTIVYAPDSIMRYVPLAALHDGNQWLAQRYQINYLTALALTPLDPDQNPNPRVLAAALTQDRQLTLLGKTYTFPALQFTQPEVKNLAQLLPNTTTLIDQTFNRANLSQHVPQSTILHLATHGMFVPGSPDQSIILLGDGSSISLREIEQQWQFPNLSLVVLSACETAIGGKLGNGIEILGFGYQMQRTGSRAAISSLWKVDDGGTQVLMTAFYTALKQGMTKAQALQETQKALITGNYSTVGGRRSDIEVRLEGNDSQPEHLSTNKLSHPYYWSPFILIGNGL
ncbi:CHAT domain-containing protein [Pantanalinema rosaneae CENA516]|uniref:CHAT domain-containing protein n=1 Tax=Pantanalinema rosaneae TaxID=1620701 RepID=UPI003D6F9588